MSNPESPVRRLGSSNAAAKEGAQRTDIGGDAMCGAKIRTTFPGGRKAVRRARTRDEAPGQKLPSSSAPVSRVARMLALAHQIERLIDTGELTGYAEAAGSLKVTRARVTQLMNLLLLAPEMQEQILGLDLAAGERGLRDVTREASWDKQLRLLSNMATVSTKSSISRENAAATVETGVCTIERSGKLLAPGRGELQDPMLPKAKQENDLE